MNYKNFDPVQNAKDAASALINDAFAKAIEKGLLKEATHESFVVEIPTDVKNGDFATNAALVNAKTFGTAPRKISEAITSCFELENTPFERFEIAGPGFINLFLSKSWFSEVVKAAVLTGEDYGRTNYGNNSKVMVEFVSANPTGPMHLGNARGGALGDCLSSCLDWAGYDVTREFYVNDAGNQIEKFAKSLSGRYLQLHLGEDAVEFPEDGYQGEDIKVRAGEFSEIYGDKFVNSPEDERKKALVDFALPKNVQGLKDDLGKYRINYDNWFLESTLHDNGDVKRVVEILLENGAAYEEDGTIWYKSSSFGAEKDDVLVRANGIPTYFAADIAYHYNKFAVRGFEKSIEVWGADHHGHVARMKGAMDSIGISGTKLDVVLMQLVRLVRDGEVVRMSKRTGKAITLTDLLEEVPIDSARFFFNLREPSSHFDFDLDMASKQDSDNPVYYVQYAHARICSIISALATEGVTLGNVEDVNVSLLTESAEVELIRHISCFPGEIVSAAKQYDPARITRFVIELATLYHKFYNNCRVRCEDKELCLARLALCTATKNAIHNALTMLKITVPERM